MNNSILQGLVETAKTNIPGIVVKDSDFFLSGLSQFSMTIISDNDEPAKQEPDYGSLLPETFAGDVIASASDIPVHYIHIMGHKKCMEFWATSPVEMSNFDQHEVEFMDEVYIQCLTSVVAPSEYSAYPRLIDIYDEIFNQTSAARTVLNSLLTTTANTEVPQSLKKIHQALYAADPLLSETFNIYVASWAEALKDVNVKNLVKSY